MALNKTKPKKTQKKNTESIQGHKLVWFTLIIIAIPVVIVAYVLLTSMGVDRVSLSLEIVLTVKI